MRLVFGVLSNKNTAGAITQLADALAPHRILVHHDSAQAPDPRVSRDNVSLVSPAMPTKWGDWSIVRATIQLIRAATAPGDCDYFQLLSESCLPVRPVHEFEAFLSRSRPSATIDMLPVRMEDIESLAEHAWRYLPRARLLGPLAHRASRWLASGSDASFHETAGIRLRVARPATGGSLSVRQRIGRAVLRQFFARPAGAFPLGPAEKCWIGGEWFGISGEAARRLLLLHNSSKALQAHYSRCLLADESYFQTLIAALQLEHVGAGSHALFWGSGARGPDLLQLQDFDKLMLTEKFFARKFSLDPNCPLRRKVLSTVMS